MSEKYSLVLFSAGLDSAVLLAEAARKGPVRAIHISVGFAWEQEERAMGARLLAALPFAGVVAPAVELQFDMRDLFPPSHWAVRGVPPGFDTPDEDVYLEGRNVILISKAAVYVARDASTRGRTPAQITRLLLGSLAGNPFPDATPAFFRSMGEALTLGLASPIEIDAPFRDVTKSAVIQRGIELGVPLQLTLSCMQPQDGLHCGRCSKCRERRDAFRAAGVTDPTVYRQPPTR
jgi:7-cyano-7-deazaguanine synthase